MCLISESTLQKPFDVGIRCQVGGRLIDIRRHIETHVSWFQKLAYSQIVTYQINSRLQLRNTKNKQTEPKPTQTNQTNQTNQTKQAKKKTNEPFSPSAA
jgi:hypothetical protein